jgi:predicted phage terminase large subunit-like protein
MKDVLRYERLLKYADAIHGARESLVDFARFTSPHDKFPDDPDRSLFLRARHFDVMGHALEAIEARVRLPATRKEKRNLIINAPVRHGKTLFATQKMAAWFGGRNPDLEAMIATYGDKFAKQYRSDVAAMMRSHRFRQVFPDHRVLDEGTDEIINHLGKRQYYLGRRSPTNGRGFNLGIIDDPIKDDREAKFQAYRDDVWEWLIYTLMNRAHDDRACLVITSARWHEDDVIGRLTDPTNPAYPREVAETFDLINLPALAVDEDDPLGRQPGEALWPERHSAESLGRKARDLPVMFSALYQGNPTPAEGVFYQVNDLHTYKRVELPETVRFYGASDHAVSTKATADRTCAGIFAISIDGYAYVMPDILWRKVDSMTAVEEMLRLMRQFNPLWWYAEAGHITRSIGPFLAQRMREEGLHTPIIEDPAVADKMQRAQSARARCSQGRILFPEEAPWWPAAKEELLKFPNGRNDDFVDFLSIIGMKLEMHVAPGRGVKKNTGPAPGSWAALKAQFKEQDRQASSRWGR